MERKKLRGKLYKVTQEVKENASPHLPGSSVPCCGSGKRSLWGKKWSEFS